MKQKGKGQSRFRPLAKITKLVRVCFIKNLLFPFKGTAHCVMVLLAQGMWMNALVFDARPGGMENSWILPLDHENSSDYLPESVFHFNKYNYDYRGINNFTAL